MGASGSDVGVEASRAIQCHVLYLWDLGCADAQTLKIVRCPLGQGRPYHDCWAGTKHPLFFYFFSRGIYGVSGSLDPISMYLFFTVSLKVLGKVVVVGSGQNKNLLWECDHWTKVRLRRDEPVI